MPSSVRQLGRLGTIYKGAAPGTHWERTDARTRGNFQGQNYGAPWGVNDVVRHITGASHPSAFCSFTTSYAVAQRYASGPPGSGRGLIYVVDPARSSARIDWVNPVEEIAAVDGHYHEGDWKLLEALVVASAVTPVAHYGGAVHAPAFRNELRAILFALRDSEVLVPHIPATCIVDVVTVTN